ncbi:MAG TPA: hypothetical protein DD734_05165 [Firmicutes bacterium]|nr:hypothetical protein [Bacillota bacterium]HBR34004.1 hypothetical protein [Bacillota bacterium]
MRGWFIRFMHGRNGTDEFSLFLSIFCLITLIFSRLLGGAVGFFLHWLGFALLFWCYFRIFSRKLDLRQRENQKYLAAKRKFRTKLKQAKTRFQQRHDYRFFKCPACRITLRVPKGKGKILIRCKCGENFTRKS